MQVLISLSIRGIMTSKLTSKTKEKKSILVHVDNSSYGSEIDYLRYNDEFLRTFSYKNLVKTSQFPQTTEKQWCCFRLLQILWFNFDLRELYSRNKEDAQSIPNIKLKLENKNTFQMFGSKIIKTWSYNSNSSNYWRILLYLRHCDVKIYNL